MSRIGISSAWPLAVSRRDVLHAGALGMAGFSLGQADILRKAMGKKDPAVMAKQRAAFVDGARANGINEKKAIKLFELIEQQIVEPLRTAVAG